MPGSSEAAEPSKLRAQDEAVCPAEVLSDARSSCAGGVEERQPHPEVIRCRQLQPGALESLFSEFSIAVRWVESGAPIPGSHWGEPEAGMLRGRLYVRGDTPVHSALHEGAHLICMGAERRAEVDTDAGGEEIEECAVCYLQILLADFLEGVGSQRLMRDMDAWGYSFRLGSARAWFEQDAEEVLPWLEERGLLLADELSSGVKRAGTSVDAQP